jgi:D-alanyl-D-alanine carboxypeptidase
MLRELEYPLEYELDGVWLGEVNRRSRDYIRWVQHSLNRIIGAGLVVDGRLGPRTCRAIRHFQRKQGLEVDGIVGRRTEEALIAAGAGAPPGGATTPVLRTISPTGFKPTSVEFPGGGRIKDKRDPAPAELVVVTGYRGKRIQLHRLAAKAWQAMVAAARADGIPHPLLFPTSGYRSSKTQAKLWQQVLKRYGSRNEARKWVAPPGGSAHQSGRAIDLWLGFGISSKNVRQMRQTRAYKWLVNNAELFGFYPYQQEPWHWEYNPPARVREAEWELEFEIGC